MSYETIAGKRGTCWGEDVASHGYTSILPLDHERQDPKNATLQ